MNLRCIICEGTEWKNVDQYRLKKSGMSMCKSCGFVTYEKLAETDLKKFYEEDYRKAPTSANFFTGERKVHYHSAFLKNLLGEWHDEKKTFLEIGAAFGMVGNWIKGKCPKWDIYGTELTKTFKRVAKHDYGLTLTDDFDESIKYDLIMSYKVAEHQKDVDLEFDRYAKVLNPGGRLYIGVPQWFGKLCNFGMGGFDIEYYYHPNHINVWTKRHFEGLLARKGWKIIEQNHTHYDSVYLCEYTGEFKEAVKENPEDIEQCLSRVKSAHEKFVSGDYKAALSIWPNFPEAYRMHYEMHRSQMNEEGFENIVKGFIEPMLKACENAPETLLLAADIMMRYEKWNDASEFLEKCLEGRANMPQALNLLGQCQRQLGDFKASAQIMEFLSNVSSQMRWDAITWYYKDLSMIPTEEEQNGNN